MPDHLSDHLSGRIDLRSDTLTTPTAGMRQAMAAAEVGDDVYDEDPSCHALEERVADLLGHEAALFTPTGSLANVLGVQALVEPGQELLCEANAHVVRAELGAHAYAANVTTRTWSHPRGLVELADVRRMASPGAGPHLVATAAVAVENSHNFGGGSIQPLSLLRELRSFTAESGVAVHIDGARLWNAAVATGVPLATYGACADTVAVCLSKGLGAPVGSLVVGSAERIAAARMWRKRLGAGWRQAGVLAAAGLYALDHHIDRLAEDHANARLLAGILADAAPETVRPEYAENEVETNMVQVDLTGRQETAAELADRLAERGVRAGAVGPHTLRLVTHLGVDEAACRKAGEILAGLLS